MLDLAQPQGRTVYLTGPCLVRASPNQLMGGIFLLTRECGAQLTWLWGFTEGWNLGRAVPVKRA